MINQIYFNIFPELETERLIFRKYCLDDAPDVFEMRSDDKVMNFMDSEYQKSKSDAEDFITNNLESYKNKEGIFWAIIKKGGAKFIGDFVLRNISIENRRAEVGYMLKPEFWRKGYMQETMNELIKFGFYELNLHSIEAEINPENKSSRTALLKLGFNKEAYFHENRFFKGQYLDSEIYSLLKSNFEYK